MDREMKQEIIREDRYPKRNDTRLLLVMVGIFVYSIILYSIGMLVGMRF